MAERAGIDKIQGLRRRWVAYRMLADVIGALAIAILSDNVLSYFGEEQLIICIILFLITLGILTAVHRPWAINNKKVAALLDKEYPELQESSHLILLPPGELNILQTLALSKVTNTLSGLRVSKNPFIKPLLTAFGLLAAAVLGLLVLHQFYSKQTASTANAIPAKFNPPNRPEKVLPQIEGLEISVSPPAYTRRVMRTQDKFNLVVEEGASVRWTIKTNVAIKKAFLLFNDKEQVVLKNVGDHTEWAAQRMITKPGFYQVSIDGKLSDLYQLQVVKDAPPVIHIKTPKQYTYIDAGEAPRVNIQAALNDDYGISDAVIMATVAKGKGEGVKFKEYKLNFAGDLSAHNTAYNLQKMVSLPALDMVPGDELYFYVQATDTHRQQSRTDVYTVSIQDTAELLSMNGMLTGANLKPEFFRSERQIIIDAERLLKEKDSISVEKFNSRSNDLGIDQKLLRLRYGKFLGEEGEDAIGAPDNTPADPADFSNAQKILKEYTDDHDNAEDAGFFEPAIKAQLKATLTEMWKAELQLRLYKPQAALPFAYKALRLLKDLQQKSRSYVAKTAYNPAPLKPEKRLSGELDKIIQPVNKADIKPAPDRFDALRKAVSVLEALKSKPGLNNADARVLQLANQQLSARASAQPGIYLPALSAMRRILSARNIKVSDVNIVEHAIQSTLTTPKQTPAPAGIPADMGLSREYYKNLKQANR